MKSKIMRMLISFGTALYVMFYVTTPAYAATGGNGPFIDIIPGDYGFDEVVSLGEVGVVKGCKESRFRPNDEITVGEFVCLLERAFGVAGRIPSDWNWKSYSSEWFDSAVVDCCGNQTCRPSDEKLPGYMAAKLLLSILGENTESMKNLVSLLNYKGLAVSDTTEYTLTAASRGYIPHHEGKYAETGGYGMFENLTRIDAAVMIYMTMQEVL